MRIKNLKNTGVTLLEILMAAIIFVISVAGIFATLNAVRTPVANKEGALASAIFGKQVLEALRTQVSQGLGQATPTFYSCANGAGTVANPCQDFALSAGHHQISVATLSANGLTWPPTLTGANGGANPVLNYTVTCADGNPSPCTTGVAHRVDLNINY